MLLKGVYKNFRTITLHWSDETRTKLDLFVSILSLKRFPVISLKGSQ